MKNKIFALLALVMALAVLCTMSVAIFADDTADAPDSSAEDTANGETTGDTTGSADDATDSATDSSTDSSTETEEKEEETKEPTWWDNYNQIIGWIVAAIIFVAIVIVSIWWIKSGFRPTKKN